MRPVLFDVFGIPINSYGVCVGIGALAAFLLARRLAVRTTITTAQLLDLTIICVVSGVVGGRLLYVFLHWDEYSSDLPSIFRIWEQGLTSYGAMIAILAALTLYARRASIPLLQLLDLVAAPGALAYAFGRIGCFMAGCCHGSATDLPWACAFPYAEDPSLRDVPVHPAQLYAAFLNFLFAAWLSRLWTKRRFEGQVFFCYLMLYSAYRVFVEFFRRGATSETWLAGLTPAQWAAILLFGVASSTAFLAKRREAAPDASTTQGADSE
jgi:phosphatidylglycerol:prolipoprotein diacylglycerol transferase